MGGCDTAAHAPSLKSSGGSRPFARGAVLRTERALRGDSSRPERGGNSLQYRLRRNEPELALCDEGRHLNRRETKSQGVAAWSPSMPPRPPLNETRSSVIRALHQ